MPYHVKQEMIKQFDNRNKPLSITSSIWQQGQKNQVPLTNEGFYKTVKQVSDAKYYYTKQNCSDDDQFISNS